MTDAEIDHLFHLLSMRYRRKVVRSLMAGNDVGCFTTQQYLNAWNRIVEKGRASIMDLALAERHLRSLRRVREVRAGVWALEMLKGGE